MIFELDQTYTSRSGLNHTRLFFYEKKFFNEEFVQSKKDWMENNWHMSIVYAAVYILAIFAGQTFMKNRERYDLRRCLIAWNMVLAIFSITGAVRTWPEFYNTLTTKGVEHSVCSNDYTHGVSGCWAWLFILSKVPELVDTMFIVARKQQLIFLHWYHHATVLIYCWYSCKDFSSSGRWFVIMNYTVHAVMYSYYALRAMRFNIPKWVNMTITTGQISQMIIGIYVNCVAYSKRQRGEECHVSDSNIMWSFIMYFSYFVLFFHFFYKSYISAGSKTSQKKQQPYANGHSKNHVHQNGNSVHANGHTKKAQ